MKRLLAIALLLTTFAAGAAELDEASAVSSRGIENIKEFLDRCPQNDPALAVILADFEVQRKGRRITMPPCTEPATAMPLAQYTDELIVLQGLRVLYYMDRGRTGHVPWTTGTVYDWMRSRVQGIAIVDGATGGWCCLRQDGKDFMMIGAQNDMNRDFDRKWAGLAGNIDLYVHEARHMDGYSHGSCCGIQSGCDLAFDLTNLSPYGVQWWLNAAWLDGTINVGYGCMSKAEVAETTRVLRAGANEQYRERFCFDQPPLLPEPANAGGRCVPAPKRRAARK